MKNKLFKKALIILGVFLLIIVVLVTVGPFFVKVTPLEGLSSPAQAASNESNFVTVAFEGTDGIDIHYLEGGSATNGQPYTFVLLHGSNFNAFTWNEVIDFFGEYGHVVAYDQIPYGLSEKLVEGDWTEGNPYSSTAAVEQLFSFLDALEVDNVVLVGNSYGATLAVQAVLANPERIDGLILVDAAVYVQEEMPAWLMNSPQMQRVGPLFARQLGQSEAFISQTYSDPEKISEERMRLTTIQTQVIDWDMAYWEYLKVWGADAPDYVSMLSEIQQPTLVISGDNDHVVPLSDSERLNAELSNSEFIVLANCGHVPQEECPTAFEDAIADWLIKLD
jgi:pimeloyl-ACP methyl ester carboxylesterase